MYMQRKYRWVPKSRVYPIDEVLSEFGHCFTSSVSHMIAYAILKGYKTIGLWGIDLSSKEEYEYQRATVLHLLGVAKARGGSRSTSLRRAQS